MMLRPQTVPSADYQLILRGRGVLEGRGRSIPIVSFSAERLKYRPDLHWEVQMNLGAASPEDVAVIMDRREELKLSGTSSNDELVEIPGLQWTSKQGDLVIASSYEVRIGVAACDATPDELYLTAYLSDNAVAMSCTETLFLPRDGSTKAGKRIPPHRLRSRMGMMRLWQSPVSERVQIGGREAAVRRSTTILQIKVPERRRSADLPGLLEEFGAQIDEVLPVLSLFSRQQVGCFVVAAAAHWESPHRGYHLAECWRYAPGPEEPHRDRLIAPRRMSDTELDEVVKRLRADPQQRALRQTISYITAAHHQTYIEHRSLYAFTALESLVDALHQPAFAVEGEAREEVELEIRKSIRESSQRLGLTREQRRDLYAKIREVPRRPVVTRIMELLDALTVPWEDLWPGKQIEEVLRSAYERRNEFFHGGRLAHPGRSAVDGLRITALAERIVLKRLGVPPEWILPYAYDHARNVWAVEDIGS